MTTRSQPSWAAWIEIVLTEWEQTVIVSQPTRAAWIEIHIKHPRLIKPKGRSPLGLRGLKLIMLIMLALKTKVAAHSGCVD